MFFERPYYPRHLHDDSDSSDSDSDQQRGEEKAENTRLTSLLDTEAAAAAAVDVATTSTQTGQSDADFKAQEGDRVVTVSVAVDPTQALLQLSSNPDAGTTFNVLGNDALGRPDDEVAAADAVVAAAAPGGAKANAADESKDVAMGGDASESGGAGGAAGAGAGAAGAAGAAGSLSDDDDDDATRAMAARVVAARALGRADAGSTFLERTKWIPLRLDYEERKSLRLCEAALNVSEYTSKVDIVSWKSKAKRMHKQLKDICAILCGLVVASDYSKGQRLIKNKQFKDNEALFQNVFEIGRRYKVMNPDRMRNDYGKLLYLLQDATSPRLRELLEFNPVIPIRTVFSLLEEGDCLELLSDPLMEDATREIVATPGKPRREVQAEIDRKNWAIKRLSRHYARASMSVEAIEKCLYSISDNNSYLTANRDPCAKMIKLLRTYFRPNEFEEGFSLAIASGRGGARLSHSHSRQYSYVLQSLHLWKEINEQMFRLWLLSEEDLLDPTRPYRLTDTGQGLNRMQGAPRIANAMSQILHKVHREVQGQWIGSSVVHLGDHNVPNALNFIDKYTQVGRILRPIVTCIEKIDSLMANPGLRAYLESTFGGTDRLKKVILCDFFRHGFDGSGADNSFDAGSCIDGRLTSAWNWCSKIAKKSYFPVFQLTDFMGFDGDFR